MPAVASLRVETVAAMDAVDPEAWDELAAGRSLFVSRPWLGVVERDRRAVPSYLLARDGAKLVAALPLYEVVEESNPCYRVAEELPGVHVPSGHVVGGARRGYRNELLGSEEGVSRLAEAALAAGRPVVFFFLGLDDAEALSSVEGASRPLLQRPEARLDAPGGSFEDYLGSLRRDRRHRVRREVERFLGSDVQVARETVPEALDEAPLLLVNVERKHGGDPRVEPMRGFLAALDEAFGPRCVLFTSRRDGRLVAFSLAIEWGERLYVRAIGFDYDAEPPAGAYFNLGYYEPLRRCYERGLSGLHLGIDSYPAKVHRGARLEPLWAVVLGGDGSGPSPADVRAWNERRLDEWRRRLEADGIGRAAAGWRLPGER
jgi:hypothetical protein